MFNVNDLHREEVFVEKELTDKEVSVFGEVNAASIATTINATATITTDEITSTCGNKVSKTKAKRIVLQDSTPVKSKKKDQIRIDEEATLKLQAEFEEEKRLAREKEQQELTDVEKATLFMQFLEKRRKLFAAKATEEKRNKPPTQAQQRKNLCTYLKNVEGKKIKDLKNKSFDSIQKMFDRAFKRVNTCVDFRTELVKGSSKRARKELTQGSSKKQKVNDNKETAELKELMEIIPDKEEVEINVIPLAVKSPKIVN
uniref:Uncharacterized protein n=1 Tax=Tanacetum cinerariifolium TaxID=118510 RepID=A0A699KSC8_TANCI|nr:hypothetical protein [Tanacetum cinerariifolium]